MLLTVCLFGFLLHHYLAEKLKLWNQSVWVLNPPSFLCDLE